MLALGYRINLPTFSVILGEPLVGLFVVGELEGGGVPLEFFLGVALGDVAELGGLGEERARAFEVFGYPFLARKPE